LETFNSDIFEFARIKLINNNKMISALNLFAEQIAKMNGFSETEIIKIQLVIEETALNIIENSFDEGESGFYEIAFERKPNQLIIAFEDKGLPYELSKFEKHDDSALRLLLMRAFADEIHFHNLGKQGKRIELHINIPHKNIEHYISEPIKVLERDVPKDERPVELMMMTKEMAIELAACVYRTYGYTYISDYIYYPEKIIELLESELLRSCVAINSDGELVAHLGLNFLSKDSKVGETGQAVVDPRYRGRGLFETMKKYLAELETERGSYGFYSESVSIHPYTQKGNISLGAKESGILLGYIPETLFFKKINENEQSQRQSAILYYMKVSQEPNREVYLPDEHADMIKEIYESIGLSRNFNHEISTDFQNNESIIDMIIRPEWSQAFLVVKSIGKDFAEIISSKVKDIKNRKIDCIYIDLHLSDPSTPETVKKIEQHGFFFAGIIPELYNGDILRMQYLNNSVIGKDAIITVSDLGKKLLDYVFDDMRKISIV
jgi:serine/threonine-protein kinase RsbW